MKFFFSVLFTLIHSLSFSQLVEIENVYSPGKTLSPDPLPNLPPPSDPIPQIDLSQYRTDRNSSQASSDFSQQLRDAVSQVPVERDRYSAQTPTPFDRDQSNFDRFLNSPCYSKLGFIPGADNEARYKECEEDQSRITLPNFKDFDLGKVLMIFSLSGICIFYLWKGYNES